GFQSFMVINDLRMEDLLLNTVGRVIRHSSYELSGGQIGNSGSRDRRFQLLGLRQGSIACVDRQAFAVLHDLAKTFTQGFGSITQHLPANDIADNIEDDIRTLFSIILTHLTYVLDSQDGTDAIPSGCGYRAFYTRSSAYINCGKF